MAQAGVERSRLQVRQQRRYPFLTEHPDGCAERARAAGDRCGRGEQLCAVCHQLIGAGRNRRAPEIDQAEVLSKDDDGREVDP